jgi:hypothetical protein
MRSTKAVCVILTTFLAVISQCTISAARRVVTQTGRETIDNYDSGMAVLTIHAEYSYEWLPGSTILTFPIVMSVSMGADFPMVPRASALFSRACKPISLRVVPCQATTKASTPQAP